MIKRRSVRVYKDQGIQQDLIDKLLDAANNCPSGGNIQPLSIITIQSTEGREYLGKMIGSQPWVKNAPLSMIFCIDFNRIKKWATISNVDFQGENALSHFLIAYADLMCAAQNVTMTAESFGLGSVYVGSIQGIIDEIRDHFSIPKLVLPMMLLCIGYPESIPNTIPKLERKVITHKEKYNNLTNLEIEQAYNDKYGIFDEDPEQYFLKAYIEVIESSKQQGDRWLKLAKKRVKRLNIKNHAQFLFKLRYPTEAMVSMNQDLIKSFKNAGFNFN
ncbi:MAG: nitroreductase family protein [Candidatus Lokiarchaeota archaeon]|nr:nitroreductase family protein [Candidatus Lokiarchaeota archaeon]